MTSEEIAKHFRSEKQRKKMAALYVRNQSLSAIAARIDCTEEELDEMFIDYPELSQKFDDAIYEYSSGRAYRNIRAGIGEAIAKLNELITDGDEDQKYAYQSASTLLNIWTKIDKLQTPAEEKEDELDMIYKELINEKGTEEDSSD